jgi:hypothetical protein
MVLNTFTRLRQFTADLRCGHGPDFAKVELFAAFTMKDMAQHRRRVATVVLSLDDERDLNFWQGEFGCMIPTDYSSVFKPALLAHQKREVDAVP